MSTTKRAPRVLFVCFADSSHAQSWMQLLQGSEFDVRVFASPVDYGGLYPPRPWPFPTYTTIAPSELREHRRTISFLPNIRMLRTIAHQAVSRLDLHQRWLRRSIRTWRPDILHTMRLNPEARFTWKALKEIAPRERPRWVLSAWGSDIAYEPDDPDYGAEIKVPLLHCDGFIADCKRDCRIALTFGLDPSKVAFGMPVPGTGGLDLTAYAAVSRPRAERNVILIPKAYEAVYNKTLPILEALLLAVESLQSYEIHLLMTTKEVRMWLGRMPRALTKICHCHAMKSHSEVMDLMGRARVMIATSLSDGTPNVLVEAMAAGALPLMSPIDSIEEWITDGRNGLLAHALFPDRIAAALRRALRDDDLYDAARLLNQGLVRERADRNQVRKQVLGYYRTLLARAPTVTKGSTLTPFAPTQSRLIQCC